MAQYEIRGGSLPGPDSTLGGVRPARARPRQRRKGIKVAHAESDDEPTRRDFLYVATAGAGVVGVGAAVWPLIDQMNPSADVLALASVNVDVSGMDPGTQMTVKWRGKPVFTRRRTEAEIREPRAADG